MPEHWKFADPPNEAVFTTRSVVDRRLPIVRVTHDEGDGAWQFHCAAGAREEDALLVALSTIVALDSTIEELSDLPLGWIATRSAVGRNWLREPRVPEGDASCSDRRNAGTSERDPWQGVEPVVPET